MKTNGIAQCVVYIVALLGGTTLSLALFLLGSHWLPLDQWPLLFVPLIVLVCLVPVWIGVHRPFGKSSLGLVEVPVSWPRLTFCGLIAGVMIGLVTFIAEGSKDRANNSVEDIGANRAESSR